MDDNVRSVLHKVIQLSEQNEEFDKELRRALNIVPSAKLSSSDSEKRILNIEKYLGLDYLLDSQTSIIDYSFVSDINVRMHLISDNREMQRFRFGTRYHKIDFEECCRYSMLQGEMLLNYYYYNKGENISEIVDYIKRFNSRVTISEKIVSLTEISFNVKMWAFKNEVDFDRSIGILWDYIRKVRNSISHRSIEKEEFQIKKYRERLLSMKMPLAENGLVNPYKLTEGSQEKNLYNNMIYNTDEYKKYCYLLWLKREPYDDLNKSLMYLVEQVQQNISK